MKCDSVEYNTAPQAVSDYITAYSIRTGMGKLKLTDASVQHSVFMELSGVRKPVVVKNDGTFVCEK